MWKYDLNKDREIDMFEFVVRGRAHSPEEFRILDRNRDGVLEHNEIDGDYYNGRG